MGIVGKHFGDIPSPAQIAQDAADLARSRIRWPRPTSARRPPCECRAAVTRSGFWRCQPHRPHTGKPDKSVPLTQDRSIMARNSTSMGPRVESTRWNRAPTRRSRPPARQQVTDASGPDASLSPLRRSAATIRAPGRSDRPGDPGYLSQRLGRPPTEDEVLQAPQGNPMSATLNSTGLPPSPRTASPPPDRLADPPGCD